MKIQFVFLPFASIQTCPRLYPQLDPVLECRNISGVFVHNLFELLLFMCTPGDETNRLRASLCRILTSRSTNVEILINKKKTATSLADDSESNIQCSSKVVGTLPQK